MLINEIFEQILEKKKNIMFGVFIWINIILWIEVKI